MADTKISALTALTGAGVDAATDEVPISDASAGATKALTVTELAVAIAAAFAAGGVPMAKLATDPLARANHTGTQASTTISDWAEAVQDTIGALTWGDSALTFTYDDGGNGVTLDVAVDGTTIEVSSDALRIKEPRVVSIQVTDPAGDALTTGDGKAYFRVPSTMNGMNLTGVAAHVTTVSSSGLPTIQIANVTQAADMLSTKITIDASEKDSSTAAAAAVIDTANDDVATGDELRIDCDVAGTGAKGLIVELQFSTP